MVSGEAEVVGVSLVILTGAWRGLLPLCAPAPLETIAVLANIANNTARARSLDSFLARNAASSLLAAKVFLIEVNLMSLQ